MVYADREGHIGYQAPGRVPIRKSGNDGRQPAEGWQPENDWTGDFVPFTALPSVLDPDEGFVATANQAVVGPDYPYYLTTDWDRGYRSQRIRDLIEAEGDLSVSEMAQIQLDEQNPLAPTLVPYLLDIELPRGYYRRAQNLLREWDFQDDVDSGAAAYFNVVWSNLLRLTFHDELRERIWPGGGDRWFGVMEGLLSAPAGPWWDDRTTDDVVETRDDILREAMIAGRDEMTQRQARNPDDWSWGHLHRLDLHSPTLGESGIGPIEWLVNRDGARSAAGSSVVNATSWDATDGYAVTSSPSMRMVVSLADFDDSRWVNLTGVSGHPASDHYDDQTDLFVEGRTLPWAFSRDAVDESADDTLLLNPASAGTDAGRGQCRRPDSAPSSSIQSCSNSMPSGRWPVLSFLPLPRPEPGRPRLRHVSRPRRVHRPRPDHPRHRGRRHHRHRRVRRGCLQQSRTGRACRHCRSGRRSRPRGPGPRRPGGSLPRSAPPRRAPPSAPPAPAVRPPRAALDEPVDPALTEP